MKADNRRGFSMIEILIALMFISFAFLPVYNLFRFGQRGTWSNEKEIIATNHASDLINFLREMKVSDLDACFPDAGQGMTLTDDLLQSVFRKKLNLSLPPTVLDSREFVRTVTLIRYSGRESGLSGMAAWFDGRMRVPNYVVTVEVDYHKKGMSMGEDTVVLNAIVVD